jgi:cytochrome P450
MNQLPPGPRSRIGATYRFVFDPIESLREWVARYGYVFTAANVGGPHLFIGEPALRRDLYTARDPGLFDTSTPPTVDVLAGPETLVLSTGVEHQRDRKLLAPAFCGTRMRGFGATIAEITREVFERIPVGAEFDARAHTEAIALEVIIRVLFGVDVSESADFRAAIEEMMDRIRPGFMFARALQISLFGRSPFARFKLAVNRVVELIDRQIAKTRAEPEGDSILRMMLEARYDDGSEMSDSYVRDQLRTLLVAGFETTAVTMAWVLYYLDREEQLRAQLVSELAEVDDPDAFARVPLLAAVIDETMRLRPITQTGFRRLCKPMRLGELEVPAGVTVCPSALIVHFREDLWPEPERFDPSRFMDGRPPSSHYLPFGGGVRRCLGAAFASYELAVAIGTVLRNYELELLDDRVEYGRRRLSLGPVGGVRMRRLG